MSASLVDWAPPTLVAFGSIVAVGGTQGGYFPSAWGPSAIALLALVGVWLALGASTDGGRLDLAAGLGLLLLIAWITASISWSESPARTTLEVQRALVLLAGVTAILALASRGTHGRIAVGIVGGIVALCGYGLATRLLPERLGSYDPINGYRLAEPIGYWNGLGILAAMGLLLAVGVALEADRRWERSAAAAGLVVLAPTLYFTFSRGGWVALLVGAAAMVAVSTRRLANIGGLLVLLPAPALAVFIASRSKGLTRQENELATAAHDGRQLLLVVAACAVAAAGCALLLHSFQERVRLGGRSRRALGGLVLIAALALVAGVTAQAGGPLSIAERAVRSFEAPPPTTSPDLNDRLFTLSGSGRVDIWRAGVASVEREPLLGVGAGAFERVWQRDQRWIFVARDAHSLYLETLVELGPIGLALLLGALGVPLLACLLTRREPVVPAALGAYTAYLVHAGIDWDWELTGVTLTALTIASLGLIAARRRDRRRLGLRSRIPAGVAVLAIAAIAGIGFLGNDALERAEHALEAGNPRVAVIESNFARRWAPWSPYPLTVRGEAQLRLGEVEAARSTFDAAIDRDRGYWRAWLGLAVATSGGERAAALRQARALYPRSAEITETERLLALSRATAPAG
ncbi:MAG: O-antigen ligase family protein [Actinobacteria bacterium]|nr:O-antigen ligase family protein [Actinomycetota bacterium]